MNTQVTRGAGTLLVTSTGMATEVGHISGMLQTTKDEVTPLTRQLNALTNQILVIAGVALLISIGIGLWRNTPYDILFLTAIAFSVSAIPTGLPAVVTAILSGGTTTLAAAGAIVKRLRSVETLGSTSAINSDKTGTLTLNQMTAVSMALVGRRYTITGEGYSTEGHITEAGGQPDIDLSGLFLPMALCADAEIRDGGLVGDPTEGALVVLAAKGGVDPTLARERYPRVATLPFDAAYKFMATFHRMEDADGKPVIRAYVKGAPDQLLARASTALGPDGKSYPVDAVKAPYLAENEHLGAQGLRVLATAQRDFDPATFDPNADLLPAVADLELLALVGIVDPPRSEARDAIAKAHSAGIQVRMITGDHAVTAEAIARQLGIVGRAITGAEFSAMSDDQADAAIDDIGVIARVAPEDKVRLVEILRRKGHIVAMTGDGVNDAPALKMADIGVAMGITGTEVSKEAAVMILTDDNFATIVGAVEQGRALYDNLMRYIRFQMASLFGFIATFLGASIFNILGGVPFLPLQTLWINFTVTVFQAVGLGYSKPRAGLMAEAPRPKDAQILPRPLFLWLAFIGLIFAAITLPLIVWAEGAYDEIVAHTMGLVTFSLLHVFFSLETADEERSIFSSQLIENPTLLKASAALVAVDLPGDHVRSAGADPRHDRAEHPAVGHQHRAGLAHHRRRRGPQAHAPPIERRRTGGSGGPGTGGTGGRMTAATAQAPAAAAQFDRRLALLLAAAMFVLVVDTSLMNVSISAVVTDLGTTVSGVQSAIALEALVSAAFILISSKVGDLIGRKKAYILGLLGYAVGALAMTLAQDLRAVIIFWAIFGGLGASLLLPSMQSLIHGNFEGADQKRVYALVGASAAIAAAIGPLLGGFITTFLSWRVGFALELVVIASSWPGSAGSGTCRSPESAGSTSSAPSCRCSAWADSSSASSCGRRAARRSARCSPSARCPWRCWPGGWSGGSAPASSP